jgi:hypothetical protein
MFVFRWSGEVVRWRRRGVDGRPQCRGEVLVKCMMPMLSEASHWPIPGLLTPGFPERDRSKFDITPPSLLGYIPFQHSIPSCPLLRGHRYTVSAFRNFCCCKLLRRRRRPTLGRSHEGKYCTSLILLYYRMRNISHVQSHAFESCRWLPSRRHLIAFTERPPQSCQTSFIR